MCQCKSQECLGNYGNCPQCNTEPKRQPHKHAALIKAWADGAIIEFYSHAKRVWMVIESPDWDISSQYRVKPESKPDIVVYSQLHATTEVGRCIGLAQSAQSRSNNVKLTFDGETGKLKKVELV